MDDLDNRADSQDATDRFRARIAAKPIPVTRRDRSVAPWVLAALLLVFALGLIANPWFERSVRSQLPGFAAADGDGPGVAVNRSRLDALDARLRALEARPAQRVAGVLPGTGANERVAAAEARLDGLERTAAAGTARIDALTSSVAALTGRVDASAGQTVLTLQAARADADRAQGALVVLAARRAIESGRAAPGLAQPLRALFGQRVSPAVEAVAALIAAPVTPATLRAALPRLRGGTTASGSTGWWGNLTASLSSIVTVRDRSSGGGDALAQADAALAAGDVARAVAAVERQPASPARDAWLASARRLRAGMAGLASLEDTAVATRPVLP